MKDVKVLWIGNEKGNSVGIQIKYNGNVYDGYVDQIDDLDRYKLFPGESICVECGEKLDNLKRCRNCCLAEAALILNKETI